MKQRFLLSILFICSLFLSTKAQIGKGSVWLGGSIGYNFSKNEYGSMPQSKIRTIGILPAVGIAVKENLVTGIALSYSNTLLENNVFSGKRKEELIGGGIFIRKYFPVITRFYIFGEASAYYRNFKGSNDHSTTPSFHTTTKGWDGGLSLTPGVSFAVSKKFQLESGFNSLFQTMYSKRKTTPRVNEYNTNSENFTAGIALENESLFYIGFRVLINKG